MNPDIKAAIQAELYHHLKAAWVLAELDVKCETGTGAYVLDVALHTGNFIYANISVNGSPAQKSALSKYGIETIKCNSIEDIEDCVEWAVNTQEKHCRSQVVQMVA